MNTEPKKVKKGVEDTVAYVQEHGIGNCFDQAGTAIAGAANEVIKDFQEGDDGKKGDIFGKGLSFLAPGAIFKGFKCFNGFSKALPKALQVLEQKLLRLVSILREFDVLYKLLSIKIQGLKWLVYPHH
mgnify:CR=1 FL=1